VSCGVGIGLMIGGASAEAAGLALVAYDIWASSRRQARLTRRNQLVQIGPAIEHDRPFGITAVGGAPPGARPVRSLEERVAGLEEGIQGLRQALDEAREHQVQVSRQLTDEIARQVAEARREVFERFEDARGLLGSELGANFRLRVVGLVLLVLGLMIATVGNVVSVSC
jgi:hypothetical protein